MRMLDAVISEFKTISSNPKAQLDTYLKQGKKVIGCMPYYCPEELVHAAGMVPFGLWGAETQVSEARRYFPAFICSIIQTTLELGIKGSYKGLSAVMIPILCDSLKSMDANWRYGVSGIPVIPVAHAQNRKTHAGAEFTASQYRKIKARLEEISKSEVSDAALKDSISVYTRRNAAMRRFSDELANHPGAIKASERNAVFKSGYFMLADEYARLVEELNGYLAEMPSSKQDGASRRVPAQGVAQQGSAAQSGATQGAACGRTDKTGPGIVTCGILADNTGLLKILDKFDVNIVGDMVQHESLRYLIDAPDSSDPIMSLALTIGAVEGCPVLYDPGKKRAGMLIDTVKSRSARGVLFIMTKFCDPEEYDIVPLKKVLDNNGIKSLCVEVDQQTTEIEQVRTAIETFCEMI